MKNVKKSLAALLVMMAVTSAVNAQSIATADAHATIVEPIEILKALDLNFGNVAIKGVAGTVLINPVVGAGRTAGGGVTFSTANPGTVQAAKFNVTGTDLYTYSITSARDSVTIENQRAGLSANKMGVSGITVSSVSTVSASAGALGSGNSSATPGADIIYVGGTLNVGASQEYGLYSTGGNLPISLTVNYN